MRCLGNSLKTKYCHHTIAMEGLTGEEMENDQPENKKNVITKVQTFIQDGCGC